MYIYIYVCVCVVEVGHTNCVLSLHISDPLLGCHKMDEYWLHPLSCTFQEQLWYRSGQQGS